MIENKLYDYVVYDENKKDIYPGSSEMPGKSYLRLPGPLNLEDFEMFRRAYRLITPDRTQSLEGFIEFLNNQKDPYPSYGKK